MLRSAFVALVVVVLAGAPAVAQEPAREVTLEFSPSGSIQDKIRIDLARGTFERTRTSRSGGATVRGEITRSLRQELDAALGGARPAGTDVVSENRDGFGRVSRMTIRGDAPSDVKQLRSTLFHVLTFTEQGWTAVGTRGEDMTRFFEKAPARMFPDWAFAGGGTDAASQRDKQGFTPALNELGRLRPLRALGETFEVLRARWNPAAYNRSRVLEYAHSQARFFLNGDVTDEQILRRLGELRGETTAALPGLARARGISSVLEERTRAATRRSARAAGR